MNYRQRNKSFVVVFVVFFLIIILRIFFSSFFNSLFTSLARPLWTSRSAVLNVADQVVPNIEPRSVLVSRLNNLQNETTDLRAKNLELQSKIETLSNSENISSTTLVIAKVLSRPPYTPFDSIIIDKGATSGLLIGDTVYSNVGIAVGMVTLTTNTSAQVFLYSSGGNTTVAIISRTGESVSLRGMGGGNFNIQLPKDFNIVIGDTVTSSESSRALIAQVYSIDSTSSDSFKKVFLRLPKNILNLEWVGVDTINKI